MSARLATPTDLHRLALDTLEPSTVSTRPYRHAAHLDHAPTRAQLVGRRLAALAVAAALFAGLGYAGSADLAAACGDHNVSEACQ